MSNEARFHPDAAAALRAEIRATGGMEVFAVGEVGEEGGATVVLAAEVHARGTEDAVLALRSRPRHGQVVIHNHPSGDLRPSEPDMALAHSFGEDGVGFVIVDNAVSRANWVVEPSKRRLVRVDPAAVEGFFRQRLPAVLSGWEPRPGQVDMALRVAETFHEGGVVVLEAGTGTGKSLAYLVPAALWALANDSKVVVSTYTRTLQSQLVGQDLPLVARLLEGFRYAILKGRSNYLCRRRLGIAVAEQVDTLLPTDPEGATRREKLRRLAEWAGSTEEGDFAELGFDVDGETWDLVESDGDLSLRARCEHYNRCFYYQARRKAAAAHLIVGNHALVFRDLAMKRETNGVGVLPKYDRLVLDEAHHVEAAATSAGACRLTARIVSRAVGPVLDRPGKVGALSRLAGGHPSLDRLVGVVTDALTSARDSARIGFDLLGEGRSQAERITGIPPEAAWVAELAGELDAAAARLGAVEAQLELEEERPEEAQPRLDLGRARRRLLEGATLCRDFLEEDEDWCRYLDPGAAGVAMARVPVDIGPFVHGMVARGMEAAVLTSATLSVNGKVDHYLERVGLHVPGRHGEPGFAAFPSPFDYERQALLVLPRDLPAPDAPDFLTRAGALIVDALRASHGGAFVLCTSYAAVDALSALAREALGAEHAVLAQGTLSRERLLARFRDDPHAVLFGTDSFWEGVSVAGDGLRLVVIPRLPFRVPTEPVAAARYERIKLRGGDPFRAYALPEAVLKLRQGFGRLIRTARDRGVVMVLDRRVHEMWYGRVFLASLPPARRLVGPWRALLPQVQAFYRPAADGGTLPQ